jgi:hypothetical protein
MLLLVCLLGDGAFGGAEQGMKTCARATHRLAEGRKGGGTAGEGRGGASIA